MTDGIHQFRLGTFSCAVIVDESWQRDDPYVLNFVNATREQEADAVRAYMAQTGDAADNGSMNVLLIDTGAHRVLVDTGNGGQLFESLARLGLDPGDIDTVIITHAHGDHILGNTTPDGTPMFPNARYVISAPEWKHWSANPEDEHRINLLGIADHFDRIAPDAVIVPGIQAVPIPGHTPGMSGLLIESDGQQLLHVADAFHHPVELPHPEWYFSFDVDPVATVATRRSLLDLAAREGLLVFTYHCGFPGTGRVHADGNAWRWEPVAP